MTVIVYPCKLTIARKLTILKPWHSRFHFRSY